jgi:hypothetical protein
VDWSSSTTEVKPRGLEAELPVLLGGLPVLPVLLGGLLGLPVLLGGLLGLSALLLVVD